MKGTMMKTEKGTRRNRSDTVRTSCLQPFTPITSRVADRDLDPQQDPHYFWKFDPDPDYFYKLDLDPHPDPHYFWKMDPDQHPGPHPDPHYFWKLAPDPYPDPHYFWKLDPDPHKTDKLYRIRICIEDKIQKL
jgi:hypothetical protein